ncbi:nuclear transport factor 2 family protein [Streptomyces sp. NPDC058739]|uniref:nuclear transport factor 2 family protein n=1 Tax=Streptomyces sp. NPDC058739 TaxID=3346618 RepID=UPI0036789A57
MTEYTSGGTVPRRSGPQVVREFYRALQAKDADAFEELWTADAVYRVPVTPAGVPGEFAGRDAIVAALRGFFALFGDTRVAWHAEPMGDPAKVLATWTLEIELLSGGTYRNRGVSVFRLAGDRIAEFTEYVDTAAFLGIFAANTFTARRFFGLLREKDLDGWRALWHASAEVPDPFPEHGTFDAEPVAVHPAVDSAAVCVEYRVPGRPVGGVPGRPADGVAVLRFRDGLVTEWHDYPG